jgi:hypothetical protein
VRTLLRKVAKSLKTSVPWAATKYGIGALPSAQRHAAPSGSHMGHRMASGGSRLITPRRVRVKSGVVNTAL